MFWKTPFNSLAQPALVVWTLAALPCGATLTISLSGGEPGHVEASLAKPAAGGYSTRNGGTERPAGVRCDRASALRLADGVQVASGCGTLRWRLNAGPYPTKGIMASEQGMYYAEDSSWWLVTEGAGILRMASDHAALPRVRFRLNGRRVAPLAGPNRLPGLDQPPGFWLLGRAPRVDIGPFRHFFDRFEPPAYIEELLNLHAAGVGFLANSLPGRALSPVFWLGLEEWQTGLGGAAGTGLVLANYPLHAHDFDAVAQAITLYLVLHEHSHQLLDASGALWIDESLASYLAVVAMREAAPQHYPTVANAFIETGRHPDVSLPVLGARAAAGDGVAYGRLYSGAAFWVALEEAMPASGSLLQQLPIVAAHGFDVEGQPLPGPLSRATGIPERELAEILDRFLCPPIRVP